MSGLLLCGCGVAPKVSKQERAEASSIGNQLIIQQYSGCTWTMKTRPPTSHTVLGLC